MRSPPEHEVFAAADRVLARGERPTTERVRAELGRGSPVRVGSLLETWWEALAQRLAGETRLPELPPAVAEAFRAAWASAVDHGTALAQTAIADTAAQLAQERTQLAADREQAQAAVATARRPSAGRAKWQRRWTRASPIGSSCSSNKHTNSPTSPPNGTP